MEEEEMEEEEEEEEVEVLQTAPQRPRQKRRMVIELQCSLDGRYWSQTATRRCIVRDWKELGMVQQLVVRLVWRHRAFFVHERDDGGGRWLVSSRDHLGMRWLWVQTCAVTEFFLGPFVILGSLDGVSVKAKQWSWFIMVVPRGPCSLKSIFTVVWWFHGRQLVCFTYPQAWPSSFFQPRWINNCFAGAGILEDDQVERCSGVSLDGALSQAIILWTICNLMISITFRCCLISRVLDWWGLCSDILLEFGWVVSGMLPSLSWFFGSLSALFFQVRSFIHSFIHSSIGTWEDHTSVRIQIWSTSQ